MTGMGLAAAERLRDLVADNAALTRELDAARGEVAAVRAGIDGLRARLVDPTRLATEGPNVGVIWMLDKVDALLAAHPAPEAAPPTLTVERLAEAMYEAQRAKGDTPAWDGMPAAGARTYWHLRAAGVLGVLGATVVDAPE